MKWPEADVGQMTIVWFEKDHTPVVIKHADFAAVSGQKVRYIIGLNTIFSPNMVPIHFGTTIHFV